jgi:hypothetical protein
MENSQQIQNNTNLIQEPQVTQPSEDKKFYKYASIMFCVFILLAIPLYFFISKNLSPQRNTNTQIPDFSIPTPTPTPVVIKNITDLKNVDKALDSLDSQSISGSIAQFDIVIQKMLQ